MTAYRYVMSGSWFVTDTTKPSFVAIGVEKVGAIPACRAVPVTVAEAGV